MWCQIKWFKNHRNGCNIHSVSHVCHQQLVCSANSPVPRLVDKRSSPSPFEVTIFNPGNCTRNAYYAYQKSVWVLLSYSHVSTVIGVIFLAPTYALPSLLLPRPPLLISVILTPPSFHSLCISTPPAFNLFSLFLFLIFLKNTLLHLHPHPHFSIPPSLHAACSYWWSLLRPWYKPTPGGFPAGVGSDGVHWEQGQADLCHLLCLQWTQCGLPGDQEWTTEEGKSSNMHKLSSKTCLM